ncbi:MAG: hypothetical protein QGI60_03025, partial [archaeon]|nr:hypothetical protein [archaeon]
LVDPLILVVLVIFGIPLWISKGTAIFILLIFMLLPVQQYFWLFIISKAVYVITLGGLIYSALFGEKSDEK